MTATSWASLSTSISNSMTIPLSASLSTSTTIHHNASHLNPHVPHHVGHPIDHLVNLLVHDHIQEHCPPLNPLNFMGRQMSRRQMYQNIGRQMTQNMGRQMIRRQVYWDRRIAGFLLLQVPSVSDDEHDARRGVQPWVLQQLLFKQPVLWWLSTWGSLRVGILRVQ